MNMDYMSRNSSVHTDDYATMSENELDWQRKIKKEPEDYIDLEENSIHQDDGDDDDDGNYWICIGLDDKPITIISSSEWACLKATLPELRICLESASAPDLGYLGSASSCDRGILDLVPPRDRVFPYSLSSHDQISKQAAFSPGRDCLQVAVSPEQICSETTLSPGRDGLQVDVSPEQVWLNATLSPEEAYSQSAQSTEQISLETVDLHEDVYSETPISGKWVFVEGRTSPQWVWFVTNPSEELYYSNSSSSHEWTYSEEVPFSEEVCVENFLSSERFPIEEVPLSKLGSVEEAYNRVCLEEAATSKGVCSETDLHKEVNSIVVPSISVKMEASCGSDISSNAHSSKESHSTYGKNDVECFFCDICMKNVSKDNFSRHMRTHVTKNPFKCNKCSKSFMQNRSLLRHLRVHNQVKSRRCNYCDKKFSLHSGLVKHLTIDFKQPPIGCSLKALLKAYYNDHCYHTKASSKLRELDIYISSDEEIDIVSGNDKMPLSQVSQTYQNMYSNQIQHYSHEFWVDKTDESCTMQTAIQHEEKPEISVIDLSYSNHDIPFDSNVKRKSEAKRQRHRTVKNKFPCAPLISQLKFDDRANHNVHERMRRQEIRHLVEGLRVTVPKVANKKDPSRVRILGEATIFCKLLQKQSQHYISRLSELRRINYRLRLRLFELDPFFSM